MRRPPWDDSRGVCIRVRRPRRAEVRIARDAWCRADALAVAATLRDARS